MVLPRSAPPYAVLGFPGFHVIAAPIDEERLAAAALGLVPAGAPLFAQVAPGNSSSLRAVLAAGYQPIGSEVLFTPG